MWRTFPQSSAISSCDAFVLKFASTVNVHACVSLSSLCALSFVFGDFIFNFCVCVPPSGF